MRVKTGQQEMARERGTTIVSDVIESKASNIKYSLPEGSNVPFSSVIEKWALRKC